MAVQIQLTLIVRNGCHLCVEAEAALARVLGRFSAEYPEHEYHVRVTDINDQVEYARFTDEVPVLLLHDRQISFWSIDENRVFEQLKALV